MRIPQRIALVTDLTTPALSASDATLAAALHERGIETAAIPWEAAETNWRDFDLVVLRACWNYHRHLERFRNWLDRLDALGISVLNPTSVARWNHDKRYLLDLAAMGVPIVPTQLLEPGTSTNLAELLERQGWAQAVVKPRVGASAYGIWRVNWSDAPARQTEFERVARVNGALVQPLMPQIAAGEWSLVFIDGAYSHAALKCPGGDQIFVQSRLGGSSSVRPAPQVLRDEAARILSIVIERWSPGGIPFLYARVDGLTVDERLVLMELELIEPGLFLDQAGPEAAARFATAIQARLAARS